MVVGIEILDNNLEENELFITSRAGYLLQYSAIILGCQNLMHTLPNFFPCCRLMFVKDLTFAILRKLADSFSMNLKGKPA